MIGRSKSLLAIAAKRRSLWLAAIGASTGIGLGFLSIIDWIELDMLPNTVVARVNQVDILRSEYQTALMLLASEKRDALADDDRALVLERLIEEELLAQYGFSSGVVRSDRSLRMAVVESLVKSVTVEFEARAESDQNGLPYSQVGNIDNSASETPAEVAFGGYIDQLRAQAEIQWVK